VEIFDQATFWIGTKFNDYLRLVIDLKCSRTISIVALPKCNSLMSQGFPLSLLNCRLCSAEPLHLVMESIVLGNIKFPQKPLGRPV